MWATNNESHTKQLGVQQSIPSSIVSISWLSRLNSTQHLLVLGVSYVSETVKERACAGRRRRSFFSICVPDSAVSTS